ncbi:Lrp/AsnC family transcriptional regulator [Nocardia tengchongensis]|uniref:Lrp/AsnC family transcriptional regulator n=1 Tax=Nocardia tengchongensis TaxID=2055889 RepID=UPI0036C5A643
MTDQTSGRGAPHLDDISERIITELQEDGRRAYATIGKVVGLSEAAVCQRVQKLADAGVIQIVAVTDPLQVGLFRQAMLAITVDGSVQPVADALALIDEINYVVICADRYDILCEAVCPDDEALLDLVSNRIRALAGVRHAEIMVYLKLRKQTYKWGTR